MNGTSDSGDNTDIILICTDRRNKSDEMLVKLFGIGIYSAIIGKDRSIDEVCRLINKPRTKKEAKQYYKIETENVNYQSENENSVSEAEVQNILAHYKRLGKNEDKYVDSFNNIVSQYTDNQLKIIIRYLPMNVKAVLEEMSPKYQELVTFGPVIKGSADMKGKTVEYKRQKDKTKREEENKYKIDLVEKKLSANKITKPIVIPEGISNTGVRRLIKEEPQEEENNSINDVSSVDDILGELYEEENNNEEITPNAVVKEEPNELKYANIDDILGELDEPEETDNVEEIREEAETILEATKEEQKRGRGRPKKVVSVEEQMQKLPKRGRGRPKKVEPQKEEDFEETVDVFGLDAEEENLQGSDSKVEQESVNLFGLDDEVIEDNITSKQEPIDLFGLDDEDGSSEMNTVLEQEAVVSFKEEEEDIFGADNKNEIINRNHIGTANNLRSLLTKDKKVVAFVGTTKNGTSFIVNNVAELLSESGISTAILDMTKSRNTYYIYTKNEEELRKKASDSITNLKSGRAEGVRVNKNLVVYTDIPGESKDVSDAQNILATLVKNYSLVLIDCDFDTDVEYFANAQEIFLVQSMDVLTIQPLTVFLRNLKSKNVLEQEKIKIVINKEQKVRGLGIKTLIGGMAFYNDPAMSFMTELLDKDDTPYCSIPFEVQTYVKYLEGLVNCEISLNGYSKAFMTALKALGDMVYPLISRREYSPRGDRYKDNFSNDMNNTLNKMKKNYE